ncbi:MAG: protein kinase [Pseudomonadota bacterium]
MRELGRGGHATVYLAIQLSLNRRVALKVMHGGAWINAQHKARFLREGRIVAKLNHPHIVPVYEVGEAPDDPDSLFMVMEFLPQGTLAKQAEHMSLGDLQRTLEQLCAALEFAHANGIVHRDVKPDNVLFRDPSHALLGDFGIARATDSLTQMTTTGAMLGTPDYMSPEQVAGGELDGRSDLYCLGVLLFELLAGYRPIEGGNVMSTGLAHLTVAPRPLPDNVAICQPLMDRLLAKQPGDRFSSAAEVAAAFANTLQQLQIDPATRLTDLYSGEKPEQVALNTLVTAQTGSARRSTSRWIALGAALAVAVAIGAYNSFLKPTPTVELPPQSAEPAPPPTPTLLERVLADADEAFRLDRWFGNGDTDAVPLYRQVLSLDPDNSVARQRLDSIQATAVSRVQRIVQQGDPAEAQKQIETLESVWTDNVQVTALREELAALEQSRSNRRAANQRAAQIQSLLDDASRAQAAGRWTGPDDSGALQRYAAVLELDPGNRLARTGTEQVLSSVHADIDSDIRAGAFDAAQQKLDRALAALRVLALSTSKLSPLNDRIAESRGAAIEREKQATRAAALDADITAYLSTAQGWLRDSASQADDTYQTLTSDLGKLLVRAPGNERLLAMQMQLEARANQQQAAETETEAKPKPRTIKPPVSF